ncbi:MAG: hypothetical protein ACR2JC_21120 [Chloroflexota bacterium]|nr:MAG: hypothetical protein DLM70_09100 [Chloroflexota bacterium]
MNSLVEAGNYRARVVADAEGRTVMKCQVRDTAGWRNSCAGTTSLVGGFELTAEHAEAIEVGLALRGTARTTPLEEGQPPARWLGRIKAISGGWIKVEVEMELSDSAAARPELILWLGNLVTMDERQTHTFRQTLLSSPTVNCQGLRGNDLPMAYFYDPRVRLETAVYVPATHLTWTTRRFLDYRCDLHVDRAAMRYGVGLVSNGSESASPSGLHRFVWYVRQGTRDIAPGEWEAQREMVAAMEQFIPDVEAPPPSWGKVSSATLQDLLDEPMTQISIDGHVGHPAYIRDTSQVRSGDRRPNILELMTQVDIIPPLLLYLKLHPDRVAEQHVRKLKATLPLFHLPAQHWVGNFYPFRFPRPIEDTWYFLENALIKLPWVAAITGDDQLWTMFLDALSGAEDMARRVGHLFPLFVEIATRTPARAATNYSVGGLYAYGQMLAYTHTGEMPHLEEAHITLATLCRLPVDRMWHEPQQLGFAAAAATLVAQETGDSAAETWARDLLAAQLRMMYWDDRSTRGAPLTGMFQGCASLLYPAFKENVESVLPWTHLLRGNLARPALLLRLLDAQRRHNAAFFDVLRGETSGPGLSIPYENLGTVELPEEGRLGKELYGTGEVFWLYLLLEALGKSDDPEVMVCSLDLPGLPALAHFPPAERSFMAFNATRVARNTTIEVPALPPGDYRVRWTGRQEYRGTVKGGRLVLETSLAAGEVQRLDIVPT